MRLLGRAEAGQRHDLSVTDGGERRHAGARRLAVEMHRAGAALGESAAEMRVVESEIVAQGIEQRHVGIGIDRVGRAVDVQREGFGHRRAVSLMREVACGPPSLSRIIGASLANADLTDFLNQRDRDYCIGMISSRWRAKGANVCGAGGL